MTDPWVFLALAGSCLLPFLLSVLLLVKKEIKNTSFFLSSYFVLILLVLAGLLIFHFYPRTLHISKLINFSFTQTGLWITLLTCLLCALLFISVNQGSREVLSRQEAACSILALYAINIAFFAGNFLLRYIFLELLALGIVLLIFLRNMTWDSFRHARSTFIFLKLGDLGMLIGILILEAQTGTLEIKAALDLAQNLPAPTLTWVQAGFILAALIKMGVWPFDSWLAMGKAYSNSSLTWFSIVNLPALGLYLLYRITPTFANSEISNILFYGSALLLLVTSALFMHKSVEEKPLLLCTLLGGLGLMLASLGSANTLFWYLIINLVIRTGFELLTRAKKQHKIGYILFGLTSAFLLTRLLWHVRTLATLPQTILCGLVILLIGIRINSGRVVSVEQRADESFEENRNPLPSKNNNWIHAMNRIESDIFQNGIAKIYELAMSVVRWIYMIGEVKFMELLTAWGTKSIQFPFNSIEERGFSLGGKKLIASVKKSSQRMSLFEERSFRKNLLWIPFVLLILILFLTLYPVINLEIK